MQKLLFETPMHNKGKNLTVRRGIKWNLEKEAHIDGIGDTPIRSIVVRFVELRTEDLICEHDPKCRDYRGLLSVMREVYEDFDPFEIVTLVYYTV